MSTGGLFSFNPAAGETPETLERRRKVAEAMIASAIGQPATTVGGGLAALGQAIGGRLALGRANRGIAAGQAGAASGFDKLLSGFGGGAAASEGTAAVTDALAGSGGGDTLPGGGGDFSTTAASVIPRLSQDLGITPQQAAGIVGQLGHESEGLKAINERAPVVPGSRGGFGWAQWTGPRRVAFERWAKDKGLSVTDPEANYGFLVHELKETPEGSVLDSLRQAPDAITAGRVFTQGFLRPGKVNQASRDAWTKRALGTLGAGSGQPAVTAALAGTEPIASADPSALAAIGAIDPTAKDDLYQPRVAALGPGPGAGPPIREPLVAPVAATVPPTAAPVAPEAPAAAGVAPVARALGVDPLPQTSGLMGPVASAGHDSLSPGAQAVTAALRGGGGADALAGGDGRGLLGRLFGPRGAPAAAPAASPVAAALAPETAALPGTEPVSGVPAAPAAGGFSPQAQKAIAVIQNPWSNEGQLAIAKSILDNEIAQADPKYRIDLEKARIDLEQARTPTRSMSDAEKRDRGLDPSLNLLIDNKGNITEAPSVKTTTVGNRTFNAATGEEIWRAPPGTKVLTPEETKAATLPLGAGTWQMDEDGNYKVIPGTEPSDPEYNDYVREEIAAGRTPVDRFVWKKAGAVSVSTSATIGGEAGADQKLRAKLSEKEGERWSGLMETGNNAAARRQQLEVLRELLKLAPQGPVTGRLAEVFPGFSTAGDAANSIIFAMAPTLRVPGSGATSDIEYAGMLRGMPGLPKDPVANQIILETMMAKSEIDMARADVISEYMSVDPNDEKAVAAAANTARKKMQELDRKSILSPKAYALIAQAGGFVETQENEDPLPPKPTNFDGDWPTAEEWKAMSDDDKALFEGLDSMASMTPEQERALALARAKVRLQEQRAADEEAAARAAEPTTTFAEEAPGVANTALERGLIGIQGIPGSVAESGIRLGGWLDRTFLGGTETDEEIRARSPFKGWTSPDYIEDYEKRQAEQGAPPPVDPQTTGGKFLAAGLQGGTGGIVGGPWGVISGIGAGLGSEGGRQLTEGTAWEGPATVFGGLAGGMSPTAVGRVISPRNIREINAAHAATLRGAGVRHLTEGQVSRSPTTMARERRRLGLGGEGRGVEQLEDHTAHILQQAGIDARLATRPVIREAFRREGQVVEDVASRNTLNFDQPAYQRIAAGVDDYNDLVPEASRAPFINRFRTEMEDLYTAPGPGAVMSGRKYQSYRSRLSRLARNTEDPELRRVFRDMQEALDEAMDRSVRPEDAGVWRDFRGRYRNLLVVEDAIATRSSEANLGLITPAALQMAMYNIYGKRAMTTGRAGPGDLTNFSTASQAIMNPLPFTGYAPANTGGLWNAGIMSPVKWLTEDLPTAVRMTGPMQQYLTNRMIARHPNATMLPPGPGVAAVTSALAQPQLSAPPRQLPPPASPIDPRTQAVIDALQ